MSQNKANVKGKVLKKILAVIICLVAVGGAGTGVYAYSKNKSDEDTSAVSAYREYTVSKGNITVGTSESGTVSLTRVSHTMPVSAEVEEVYVKIGSVVEKGDKLAKLNIDDIETLKEDYESKISDAKLTLSSALISAEEKKVQAKQTYQSNLAKTENADNTYNLSITDIEKNILTAEKNLEDLETELSDLKKLLKTYPDDYSILTEYENTIDLYNSTYKSYQKEYSSYESVLKDYKKELTESQSAYDEYLDSISEQNTDIKNKKEAKEKAETALSSAETALETAKENLNLSTTMDTNYSTIEKAYQTAYNNYQLAQNEYSQASSVYSSVYIGLEKTLAQRIETYENNLKKIKNKISDYEDMMDEYNTKMSEYNTMKTEYKEEYDEYKSEFTEKYGNYDVDSLNKKIETVQSDIESTKYNITKLNANKSGNILDVEQQYESNIFAGTTALDNYNQTLLQIESDLKSKQDNYDDLINEYNELQKNLGDGVYIYADCSGSVAEVNISEGNSFMSNQTLVSIADKENIYVSVAVAEEDISALSVGQECSVSLSAYENVTLEAEIDTIAVEPSRSSGSVSYSVTVKVIPNSSITIYSGMTAEVTFIQKQVTNTLYVNINAVKYKENGISTVLVYDENRNAVDKEVKTGFTDGRLVEIKEGLTSGERVLAESAVSNR